MKILSKIRAFFTHNDEPKEINLSAAEIRGNKVFLHPLEDAETTICLKASEVDIHINPGTSIKDSAFFIFQNPKKKSAKKGVLAPKLGAINIPGEAPLERSNTGHSEAGQSAFAPYKTSMKTVSFRVYPEEYDALMEIIRSNGYKKAEYLLACVHAAKKKSMETVYMQYTDAHRERRKADRELAKRVRDEQQVQMGV